MKSTRMRAALAASLAISLLAGACGDDDDVAEDEVTDTTDASGDEAGEGSDDGSSSLELTLSDDGLEGVPESIQGGAVEVTATLEGSREFASIDLTRVDEGTTAEQFAEEFAVVFEGGPFPDFVQANAGLAELAPGKTVTSTVLLEPGTHVLWHEGLTEGDDEAPPEIIATLVEVTEGGELELPEADGEIVAMDYGFDVSGVTGPGTINFLNEGPDQHHHAVVVDFGTTPVEVAEEAIGPLLEGGEDDPPPAIEGLDMEQVNFDFGGSGVFGPGLGGSFEADLVEGNTYALVCFISDRAGGPPHAIGMDMYEVFTVGG